MKKIFLIYDDGYSSRMLACGIVLGALKPDCSNTLEVEIPMGGLIIRILSVHYPGEFLSGS